MSSNEQRFSFLRRHFKEQRLESQLWGSILGETYFWIDRALNGSSARRPSYTSLPILKHTEILYMTRLGGYKDIS